MVALFTKVYMHHAAPMSQYVHFENFALRDSFYNGFIFSLGVPDMLPSNTLLFLGNKRKLMAQ